MSLGSAQAVAVGALEDDIPETIDDSGILLWKGVDELNADDKPVAEVVDANAELEATVRAPAPQHVSHQESVVTEPIKQQESFAKEEDVVQREEQPATEEDVFGPVVELKPVLQKERPSRIEMIEDAVATMDDDGAGANKADIKAFLLDSWQEECDFGQSEYKTALEDCLYLGRIVEMASTGKTTRYRLSKQTLDRREGRWMTAKKAPAVKRKVDSDPPPKKRARKA